MVKKYFILFLFVSFNLFSQNTVGVLKNDTNSYNGYTLFTPFTSTETYLINNCGEVVHQWTSTTSPAASVYLLESGHLLRTGKITNTEITFGGVGGKIELFDWDNNLIWEYIYSNNLVAQHHDIFPLPNGNILMLAVTTISESDAILMGRDPSLILDGKIYNEQVIELEPVGSNNANIVWEWNIKDHLIQDFDNTKANFGVVKDHPELLDFNFLNDNNGIANWLHINSMQYNADLDQIILSSRILSEIYIIDHSTTTAEASSNTGGTYGKGGDFLYRWGNPVAYDIGDSSNRTLYSQHFPYWIPDNLIDAGKIIIFNNGNSIRYSSVDIISPPTISTGVYSYDTLNGYGPTSAEWSYTAPNPSDFFSSILSSAQRLPNGNTLICDGDSGYFFEIDSNENIVWEYINPDSNNGPITQGEAPSLNFVFRAKKFPVDFPAFVGKDLTPGNPIELNFDLSACTVLSTSEYDISTQLDVYPNPTSGSFDINTDLPIDKVEIYDVFGKLILTKIKTQNLSIELLASGVYFVKIYSDNKMGTKKIIKH
ncbi:MAG: aryl-sulfate sulfotransferase [Aureibaculum sp.]|nr:aryl-sulfate sulfotransferase [Aureibaculum sp.]